MAKMSIYIPDELKARMDDRTSENWSGIAQRAFELQIASTKKGGNDMSAVVERLRASKEKIELVEMPEWIGKGRTWAEDEAEFEQLQRLAHSSFHELDDDNDPRGNLRLLALAEAFYGTAEIDRQDYDALAYKLNSDERHHPSGRQVGWFVSGAQEVWNEVKDEI